MRAVANTELESFRNSISQFLAQTSPVEAARIVQHGDRSFGQDWWRRGSEIGWTSLLVDEAVGGGSLSGVGLYDTVVVAAERGRVIAPGPYLTTNVVASALSRVIATGADGDAQKRMHGGVLDGLMAGTATATWAVFESGRRWEPESMTTQAEERADGSFLLNGRKELVEYATECDHVLVAAQTADGPSQFLIPLRTEGLMADASNGLDMTRRVGSLDFRDVVVQGSALLGRPGEALPDIERQLDVAVVIQSAETLGVLDVVLDFTLQWTFDRYSFGRPLASYQAIKHHFADMRASYEACLATTWEAAKNVGKEAVASHEYASIAASYVGQAATDIVQYCVQLHGGIGVTTEHDIHMFLRRATVNRATWGTPSDHRLRLANVLFGRLAAVA